MVGALLALAGSTSGLAASDGVVISQVYGAGGNTGASFTHDFIELFNRGTTPVVSRRHVRPVRKRHRHGHPRRQRRTAHRAHRDDPARQVPPHPRVVAAPSVRRSAGDRHHRRDADRHGRRSRQGRAGDRDRPRSAATRRLTCTAAGTLGRIVDLVGYGNATFFEGTAAAPTLNATSSARQGRQRLHGHRRQRGRLRRALAACSSQLRDDRIRLRRDAHADQPDRRRCGDTRLRFSPAGARSSPSRSRRARTRRAPTSASSADLSQIGGSDTQAFFDDGTNGDAVAGNNVFSYGATVAASDHPGREEPAGRGHGRARSGRPAPRSRSRSPSRRLAPIEISEIQGAAHLSPHNGETVTTTGHRDREDRQQLLHPGSDAGRQSGHLGGAPGLRSRPPRPASASATQVSVLGTRERVPLGADEPHADRAHAARSSPFSPAATRCRRRR